MWFHYFFLSSCVASPGAHNAAFLWSQLLVQGRRQVLLREMGNLLSWERNKNLPSITLGQQVKGRHWEYLESVRASITQRIECAERLFTGGKKRWELWSLHACESILLQKQKELFSATECKEVTEHQLFWFSFQVGEIKYKTFHMGLLWK